jgi:mono/diheme cytochrome c family protein
MYSRSIAAHARFAPGATLSAVLCVFAVVGARAQSSTPPPTEPPPKFDAAYLSNKKTIDTGKEVWEQQCRHCHGASAYPGKAPKLNPGGYTLDFIYDRVTYGFGKMPPWKDIFSLEQRMAVTAYIKSDHFSP